MIAPKGSYAGPQFALPVTADDVVRHALASFHRMVAEATPPIQYPEPSMWSDSEQFLSDFFDYYQLRLRHEAASRGHRVDDDFSRLDRWNAKKPSREQHVSEVDPGLWLLMQTGGAQ